VFGKANSTRTPIFTAVQLLDLGIMNLAHVQRGDGCMSNKIFSKERKLGWEESVSERIPK
jgi:hypothetical protein